MEFPRVKPYLGNVVVQILNDFSVQLKLLVPKEAYPSFLSSGFVMQELSGFNIWSENGDQFEGDVFCMMEALVRVFNALFEEAMKFVQRVVQ